MQIEYVTRICLTSRRSLEQQGKCTVSSGMFAQIVIYHQHILAVLHPLFTDGTARIRSYVLQRCKLTGRSGNYSGVAHRAVLRQSLNNRSNRGRLLSYGNIDTFHALPLLIDNGINSDRRLTGLSVADDQLTLSSSDRHHGVNSLDTCLQRCIYGFSCDNAGCNSLNFTIFISLDRPFAVNRLSKGIHNTPEHAVTYRHLNHSSCSLYDIPLIDVVLASEKNRTNIIFFQVKYHTVNLAGELQQLSLHGILKSVHTSDTVGNLNNSTHIGYFQVCGISLDLILYD